MPEPVSEVEGSFVSSHIADVVVVGSGAAGLAAALGAAAQGADVVVLERSDRVGGTSAVSGGVVWVPCNRGMSELGITDSYDEAVKYLVSQPGFKDETMLREYVRAAADILASVESVSSLKLHPASITDYRPDLPGAKQAGRAMAPDPFDAHLLTDDATLVRQRQYSQLDRLEVPPTDGESSPAVEDLVVDGSPTLDWAWLDAQERGLWARGLALIGGLLEGCKRLNVRIRTNVRVRRLLVENGRVAGVATEQRPQDGEDVFMARGGVVLACGGFESSGDLMHRFLEAPHARRGSPPWNEGDGLLMGMSVGASLANLDSAWWNVFAALPDDIEDGSPLARIVTSGGRGRPGSIIVNQQGRRFVNEAQPYHGVALTMNQRDNIDGSYPNLPAWLIFDYRFRHAYGVPGVLEPGTVDPPWLVKADSPSDLAKLAGVAPDALGETVDRFNGFARAGQDPDFARGESAYDQQYGDTSLTGTARCLGVLDRPPWYALRIHPGILGTNGGLRIDPSARVLNVWDEPIPGLYAAGNVTASFMGRTNIGAGATLGPAIVFGFLAGRTVANLLTPGVASPAVNHESSFTALRE
jgi:succinate dehydrogenase/fumarate reductase flavoprotein subunit